MPEPITDQLLDAVVTKCRTIATPAYPITIPSTSVTKEAPSETSLPATPSLHVLLSGDEPEPASWGNQIVRRETEITIVMCATNDADLRRMAGALTVAFTDPAFENALPGNAMVLGAAWEPRNPPKEMVPSSIRWGAFVLRLDAAHERTLA